MRNIELNNTNDNIHVKYVAKCKWLVKFGPMVQTEERYNLSRFMELVLLLILMAYIVIHSQYPCTDLMTLA